MEGFPAIVYGYSAGPASAHTLADGVVGGHRLDRSQLVTAYLSDETGAFVEDNDVPVVFPLPCILVIP